MPTTDGKGDGGLREAAQALLAMRQSITTDVGSAHSLRGNGASEWMREDDREMRKELREAFDRLEAALARAPSALTEAAKPGGELREVLADIEWVRHDLQEGGYTAKCPSCHAPYPGPHYEDCGLEAALTAPPREEDTESFSEVEEDRYYDAIARGPSAPTPPKDAGALEAAKGAREAKVLEAARSIADQARVCIRTDDPGNDRVGIRVHTLRSLQEALAEVEGERS